MQANSSPTYLGMTCRTACTALASRWCEASARGGGGLSCGRTWWGTARTGTRACLLKEVGLNPSSKCTYITIYYAVTWAANFKLSFLYIFIHFHYSYINVLLEMNKN